MNAKIVFLFVSVFSSLWLSAQPNQKSLQDWSFEYLPSGVELLKDLLSVPNDANFPEHVQQNILWCEKEFGRRGFSATRLNNDGNPLLLLEKKSARKKTKTVLFYAHADGQPVDSSRWEQESPYKPVIKKNQDGTWVALPEHSTLNEFSDDWRIFSRSASDDKGPIAMFLVAYDILQKEGIEIGFNIKVILDFEEEKGSPNLPGTVTNYSDKIKADLMLNMDGPRHISNEPTLTFGARGIATIQLRVFGPYVPQHSGHYGNYVPNPAFRLAQLLAGMKDESGKVTLPGFYDNINLTEKEKQILESVPDDEEMIRKNLGIAEIDGVGRSYQESIQYPSLNIRGMHSGWVESEVRTIIPDMAIAEIDIRLVKESDGHKLVELVRNYVKQQGYYLINGKPTVEEREKYGKIASFRSTVSYPAFRTDMSSEEGRKLSAVLERAFGKKPIMLRTSGGSIPISPFVEALKIPVITVPTVNRDNNQHSPNENLRLGNYREGIITFMAILSSKL